MPCQGVAVLERFATLLVKSTNILNYNKINAALRECAIFMPQ